MLQLTPPAPAPLFAHVGCELVRAKQSSRSKLSTDSVDVLDQIPSVQVGRSAGLAGVRPGRPNTRRAPLAKGLTLRPHVTRHH